MSAALQSNTVDRKHRLHGIGLPVAALLLAAALFPATGQAGTPSVGIHITSAEYTSDLLVNSFSDRARVEATRRTTSHKAVLDELQASESISAEAEADIFTVHTTTGASTRGNVDYPYARAIAQTVLNFRTLQDGVLPLALDFWRDGLFHFSEGFASLHDLTTDQSVFRYGWEDGPPTDNIPWTGWGERAHLAPAPELLASHDYALTLHTRTDANGDWQSVGIDVRGVHSVPEPQTWALMLLGAGLVGSMRRFRRQRARPAPNAREPAPR